MKKLKREQQKLTLQTQPKTDAIQPELISATNKNSNTTRALLKEFMYEMQKFDGFSNVMSGLGTAIDRKTQYDFIGEPRLSIQTKQSMLRSSGATRVIAYELVNDAFKLPLKINNDRFEEINKLIEKFNLYKLMSRAAKQGRTSGTAVLLWQINDGQSFDMPVIPERIKSIEPLIILSKEHLVPLSLDPDTKDRPYSVWIQGTEPEYYYTYHTQQNLQGTLFHKSRVMIFEGEYAGEDNLNNNNSFPESVIDVNKLAILLYELVVGSVSTLADSAIQEIIKLEGLNRDLDGNRDEELLKKLLLIMTGKSVVKKIALDKEDEYEYHSANFTGYEKIEQIAKTFISMSSKTPISKFFGESPSASIGSQAGSYEESLWYSRVEEYQTEQLKPNFDKFFTWIKALLNIPVKEIIAYNFPSIKPVDAKTESDINNKDADTLIKYIDKGLITVEEGRQIVATKYGIKL